MRSSSTTTNNNSSLLLLVLLLAAGGGFATPGASFVPSLVEHRGKVLAFVQQHQQQQGVVQRTAAASSTRAWMNPPSAAATSAAEVETSTTTSFIDSELRGAAMRLHTRQQAPKEGEAAAPKKREPFVPTHEDYLRFLVDSKHVYEALEDIVSNNDDLAGFRDTGLERTDALERDIEFMMEEYGLDRPDVGEPGRDYAEVLRSIDIDDNSTPELVCHYYNFYFAHTAGGRMIGKQMSALLLDKRTLDFYKWDGDLNEIKARVKETIEEMAARWSPEERQECVGGTPAAFQGGGAINSYLMGGRRS